MAALVPVNTGDTGVASQLNQLINLLNGTTNNIPVTISNSLTVTGGITGSLTGTVNDVYNILAYGADPSGVVNSTTAIQAAMTAISTAGQGILYIPKGNYGISTSLTTTFSGMAVQGDGMGISRIFVMPNTWTPANFGAMGMMQIGVSTPEPSAYFTRSNATISDLTFDFNGQNQTPPLPSTCPGVMTGTAGMLLRRVEICNRPAGCFGLFITSHDWTIEDCFFHDDTWSVSTYGTGPATGSQTVTPNAMTNITNGMSLIVDPPVKAYATIAGTGSQTVTPYAQRDNQYTSGRQSAGMYGIVPGMSLVVDVGASQETVTVSSVTLTTFTATFAKAHSGPVALGYAGNAELVTTTATTGTTFTATYALNHGGTPMAVYAWAATNDFVGGGTNVTSQINQGGKILASRFLRMGTDAVQITNADKMTIMGNSVDDCPYSGFLVQGGSQHIVANNTLDSSAFGLLPYNYSDSGIAYNPTSGGRATERDIIISGNTVIGYTNAIAVSPYSAGGQTVTGVVISGNICEGQMIAGIQLSANGGGTLSSVAITGNVVHNCNSINQGAIPGTTDSTPAIYCLTTTDCLIEGNTLVDDRGGHRMQAGITIDQATRTTIVGNHIRGAVSAGVVQATSVGANTGTVIRSNAGYNPVGAVTAPTTTPTTATFYQNTTGVDCIVGIVQAGVTGTHLYLNNTNSTTGAADFGAQTSWPSSIIVPAGAYIEFVFSAGTVTLTWAGM